MAVVTLSTYANALHNILLPYIRDNFPKDKIFLDNLKRSSGMSPINNSFYAPLRTSRNAGVTSLASDSSTTLSSNATLGQGSVGVKILTGQFDISKLAIDATKSNEMAVENALVSQARFLTTDFGRSINRQAFGDGSGIVAEVKGSTSSTEFTVVYPTASVDDGRALDYYGSINGDIAPTKYLFAGAIIGVGTAGAAIATVSSVSPMGGAGTAGTVVVTGATASIANDAVGLVDGALAGFGTSEFVGARAALSSSTGTSQYAGVARSTMGWTPQYGSVAEALTLSRIESSYLAAREYAQSGDQYIILVNKTLYKKYGDLLTSLRRVVNETDILGGYTGLEFAAGAGKVGVFLDYDVPDGEVLIINLDSWRICQVGDLDWMEDPNQGSLLRLANKIQWQATMVWFANFICLAPAANGKECQKTA